MNRFYCLTLSLLFSATLHAADYANREDVRAFVAEMESRHGFDAQRLSAQFEKTHALPSVLKLIAPPADPGIRSWTAYRQRFIEPKRIAAGTEFWQRHRAMLAKAEAQTGVPAEVIVAIIGIETFYGKYLGNFDVFAALTTLAFDYPPRADLFRRELESLLLLARDAGRRPDSYRGSFAGAIGLPQFLPSSIRHYAVDFDRSGRVDLTASPADAIGSVANFLKEHGWENGAPVTRKVDADATLAKPLIDEGIRPVRHPAEMAAFGVQWLEDAPDAPAALIDLVTPHAPTEYWLGYRNFFVITRYNRSSFYAMAVWQFAQTLRARQDTLTAAPAR